jgi:hypothetical protein
MRRQWRLYSWLRPRWDRPPLRGCGGGTVRRDCGLGLRTDQVPHGWKFDSAACHCWASGQWRVVRRVSWITIGNFPYAQELGDL